ncbi:MAG: sensor histidine kinase [Spirochaetota bacterium]
MARGPIERWRALSVGKKLILIYTFGIFVPLVLANGLVLRSVLVDVREQEHAFLDSMIDRLELAILREFEPIELVSESIFTDSAVHLLLRDHYNSFSDFVEVHRRYLLPALTKYASVFAGITRMTIYSENPILGVAAGYLRLDYRTQGMQWYAQYTQVGASKIAMVHVDRDSRTELVPRTYLSLFRELDNNSMPRPGRGRLILRIDINPSVIARHFRATGLSGSIELLDGFGSIVVGTETPIHHQEEFSFERTLSESDELRNWTIRGTVAPGSAPLEWSTRWTRLLVISGFSIAISSLFILLLSRSVTSRLRLLSVQMSRVEREDFSPIEMDDGGQDEIGQLINDYNIMARRMESLINDRYKAEIDHHQLVVARQQAELDALQSQVNPHFLFNVLESIRMKSHIKGEHETAAVVKKISRSIRRLTHWKQDLIRLDEELEFTREYIEIQQYRFGDRLRAEISIDPAAGEYRIPKLTVQGLVENALVHGLEPDTEGGTVTVAAGFDGGALRILIHDDGAGCDADEVWRLIRSGSDGPPPLGGKRHIGIANIYRRLCLHFGDRFTFSFRSAPHAGTEVEVRIQEIHEPAHADYR